MQVKDNTVNIWGLQVEMQPVLKKAGELWEQFGQELIITAGRDAMHSAGSLHYYGYAVDLRTHYFTEEVKRRIASILQNYLGSDYQVITHTTHIHVEYQLVLDKLYARLGK